MRSGITQFILFFVYLLVQVVLLKNLVLFNTSFCYLYIAYIILLPVETGKIVLMLIGFLMGVSVDVFYDSTGLHAFSLVTVAYFRNYWLMIITPQSGYSFDSQPTLSEHGLQWFLIYAIPMIFIHHMVLFFVEAFSFMHFWFTFKKVFLSFLFTLTAILILQYIGLDRSKR